ncbi:MAG TPA: hypothetical protein VFZ91_08795 [Allosphingosinicella sp.]
MATASQGLKGEWTYRSFVNDPDSVGDDPQAALNLIFGEGELTIAAADRGGFRAALSFGGKAVMDLVGSFTPAGRGGPATVAARGTGRRGSGIEDYVYDYIFFAVPPWQDGVDQRQALVGTVMRAADHGTAKKGYVASTITVRRGSAPTR